MVEVKTKAEETKAAEETTKTESKDKVIFITEEELAAPSKVTLDPSADEDAPPGLILPNGDINWNCPCLGGMAVGPCGVEFRAAFSCFHYSSAEPKGSDCIEKFADMQICMQQYPELYDKKEIDKDSLDSEEPSPEPSSEETSASTDPAEAATAEPNPDTETSTAESSETPAKTESESADLPPSPEPSSEESSPESSRAPSPALSI